MKPSRFFLRVWRWHFYAGLFSLPFLFLLACTGIVYLFRFEIEDAVYRDLLKVQPTSSSLLLEKQGKSAEAFLPGAALRRVIPPAAPDRSTAFVFATAQGEDVTVFVRPSNGEVLGSRREALRPSTIAHKIHGELFLGKAGDLLMELAASWSILLVISGLYLWLPRAGSSKIWGVMLPRPSRAKGRPSLRRRRRL